MRLLAEGGRVMSSGNPTERRVENMIERLKIDAMTHGQFPKQYRNARGYDRRKAIAASGIHAFGCIAYGQAVRDANALSFLLERVRFLSDFHQRQAGTR